MGKGCGTLGDHLRFILLLSLYFFFLFLLVIGIFCLLILIAYCILLIVCFGIITCFCCFFKDFFFPKLVVFCLGLSFALKSIFSPNFWGALLKVFFEEGLLFMCSAELRGVWLVVFFFFFFGGGVVSI